MTDQPIVELGQGIPAWVVRAALFGVAGGAVATLLPDSTIPFTAVVLIVLGLVTAIAPASPAPAVLIGAIAISLAYAGGDPLRAAVLAEIPLVHLLHLLASISALVPLRGGVVRPSAFARPARRFLIVQVSVFVVVGVAEILPTRQNPTIVEIVGIAAATGLVALTIKVLTRQK
ncbi:MAG TPA: hypothetical protein VHV74_15160 [Pseudonocardiaceae bacterium]|nr:hypothetical protein [Pseudonocardiaceae bacterium]